MKLEYITTRILQNSKGEEKGKIRIIKFKEKPLAQVEFLCPECGAQENSSKEFKKPFLHQCKNCGYKVKVISLRTEIKKLAKQK